MSKVSSEDWTNGLPHPQSRSSSMHLMALEMSGKSVIVLLSGGGPTLKHSWFAWAWVRACAALIAYFAVSVYPCAYNQTEGMQEAVFGTYARAQYVLTNTDAASPLVEYGFSEVLAVPKNMKLLAIPLFELYDNSARYV